MQYIVPFIFCLILVQDTNTSYRKDNQHTETRNAKRPDVPQPLNTTRPSSGV